MGIKNFINRILGRKESDPVNLYAYSDGQVYDPEWEVCAHYCDHCSMKVYTTHGYCHGCGRRLK